MVYVLLRKFSAQTEAQVMGLETGDEFLAALGLGSYSLDYLRKWQGVKLDMFVIDRSDDGHATGVDMNKIWDFLKRDAVLFTYCAEVTGVQGPHFQVEKIDLIYCDSGEDIVELTEDRVQEILSDARA